MFSNTPKKYKIVISLICIAILYIVFIASTFEILHKNPVSVLNQEKIPNYDFQSANGNEIGSRKQNNENEVSTHNEQGQENGNGKQQQNEEKTQPRLQDVKEGEEIGGEWKTILFYTSWFGKGWSKRASAIYLCYEGEDEMTTSDHECMHGCRDAFVTQRFHYYSEERAKICLRISLDRYNHQTPEELRKAGCPSWRCNFTMNKDHAKSADAIVFSSTMVSNNHIPRFRLPEQRWVWVNVEAPKASPALIAFQKLKKNHLESHFNWTMTYHSNADIVAFYGYLISKGEKTMPLRPNLMSEHPKAMKKYMESLRMNTTLEDIMGPSWKDFVRRPKLVAWMSGHCGTLSKREQYVNEVAKYVPLDKYGRCGNKSCQPVLNDGCWKDILGPGYLFYMSFENALCKEYITEKLYFALTYNLVPIVWGGSDYSRFLPPGSYINGRHYHPKDLASLLLRLQNDPVAYGRYHVWRGFWTPNMKGSMCELCHKLHTDKETKYHQDIPSWRKQNNKCIKSPRWLFYNDDWKKVITPQEPGTS